MTNYRFRNKPIEDLTREEAIEALTQVLDQLAGFEYPDEVRPYVHLSPEELMRVQRQKNRAMAEIMTRVNGMAGTVPTGDKPSPSPPLHS